MPDDMADALQADADALTAFQALRPDDQRVYVDWIGRAGGAASARPGWPTSASTSGSTSADPPRSTAPRTRSATSDAPGVSALSGLRTVSGPDPGEARRQVRTGITRARPAECASWGIDG